MEWKWVILALVLVMLWIGLGSEAVSENYEAEVINSDFLGSFRSEDVNLAIHGLVGLINVNASYRPGLVGSTLVQSNHFNITVRLLLWSRSCSMDVDDTSYKISGLHLKKEFKKLLSEVFYTKVAEGYVWATAAAGNLWIDYYSHGCYDKGSVCPEGLDYRSPATLRRRLFALETYEVDPRVTRKDPASLQPRSIDTESNKEKRHADHARRHSSPAHRQARSSTNHRHTHDNPDLTCTDLHIDSLISNDNRVWDALLPDQVLHAKSNKFTLEMRSDCLLVLFENVPHLASTIRWMSGSNPSNTDRNCSATLKPDGNLAISLPNQTTVWSTNTTQHRYTENHGNYRFTVQSDGNAVIVDMVSGQVLWSIY